MYPNMYPDMRHEQVLYQNPNLAIRIWQIEPPRNSLSNAEAHARFQEYIASAKLKPHWHYHEEVEFLLIVEGGLTCYCPESQFDIRKGDVAIFGALEPHYTLHAYPGTLKYIVFQIDLRKHWDGSTLSSMQHFSEVNRPLSSMNYVYRSNEGVQKQTADLIREIFNDMNNVPIGYDLAVSSRIKSILLLLLRHDTRKLLNYNDNRMYERLQPAVDHIESLLSTKLTVDDVCSLVNMSYTHFIKTFKNTIGMSFTEFIAYKRIKKAEQLLLTRDMSISEIAEAVGFSNLGHFYNMFRRYNDCSPKQFKGRLREAHQN
ncbi:AraC family transcriptional regulator [Paenibacillus sp. HB172176]|uniref:helix-turn-helix domain-containing protein n=1 Tax=Paenibacillus sp. HB172176 TaxID=2493690 RepID=UPI00143AC0A8|nr:AraC family transcriptional regulator [Paenibacillus sp. HB172176]